METKQLTELLVSINKTMENTLLLTKVLGQRIDRLEAQIEKNQSLLDQWDASVLKQNWEELNSKLSQNRLSRG